MCSVIRTNLEMRYTLAIVILRAFSLLAFSLQIAFGSFCIMPMANAAELSMQEGEHEEMMMTPMQPMSPAHCEHCAHVARQEEPQPMGGGCAGQCLEKAANAMQAISAPAHALRIAAVLPVPTQMSVSFAGLHREFLGSSIQSMGHQVQEQ